MTIDIDQLTYRYRKGSPNALTDLSMGIGPGIYLLLGENGAGKTTLLHIIDGLLWPTAGECRIDRTPTRLRLPSIASKVAFMADSMTFPADTVNATARCHAQFYPGFDPALLKRNLEAFGLTGDERLDQLSLGNLHKAQIAYMLSLQSEILLLDEPANGLDIESRQRLQRMIAESTDATRQTIIVSTHTFGDLRNLYDGVIILSRGRLLLAASVDQILSRIAFVGISSAEPDEIIYAEPRLGRMAAIVRAEGDEALMTDIDFGLLYNAVKSPDGGERLIKIITDNE